MSRGDGDPRSPDPGLSTGMLALESCWHALAPRPTLAGSANAEISGPGPLTPPQQPEEVEGPLKRPKHHRSHCLRVVGEWLLDWGAGA